MTLNIEKNIHNIRNKINSLCKIYQKDPSSIQLVAVSKFQSIEAIEQAYGLGIRDFGENYIQEWQKKSEALSHLKDIRWHIIGHLQKNKAKYLNSKVSCLQTLDSLSSIKELEKKWVNETPLNTLLQLQIDIHDENKSGASYQDAIEIVNHIGQCSKIKLCGFMGIGPDIKDKAKLRNLYTQFVNDCYKIWKSFISSRGQPSNAILEETNDIPSNSRFHENENRNFKSVPIISLGMSADLDIAIECGSNMVRVGSAIFGARVKI